MDNQKIEAILDSLLKLSEEEKLDWKRTASDNTYLLTLEDSSISIRDVAGVIKLDFRDETGNIVEGEMFDAEDSMFEKSVKLYDLARRKATNADATLDRILEQLNSGNIPA